MTDKVPKSNYVQFILDDTLKYEEYQLTVNKSSIFINAKNDAGFLYGLETVRQLLPVAIESKTIIKNQDWQIPNSIIKDRPRFKYRGLMLDVSRHFFDIDYLKKTIDRLAMLKMNVLHLHLVDDQGWRIEIKKYPKLTEVGAWRVDQEDKPWNNREKTSPEEKGTYGGFYTQEELKGLVKYAKTKNVEIIPEIEMPAHVSSAIAAYPKLSCHENHIGVPSGGVWPINDIYCPGKENTFIFLENVLKEVIDIFPSKYIHIGGDEATKTNWLSCPDCKKRMLTEGINHVDDLQSYFIKRIEKFINSEGRQLIGWDEILEGGLAPEATVMSWRGVKGGVEAAKLGHDVIMTPGTHCYFDHYQGPQNQEPLAWGGYTPLSKVYEFDPVVGTMTENESKHVLGGQANLWSEYIETESHSEYMIFPRLVALSETLWSTKESRSWKDFSERTLSMFSRFEYLGINYAKSAYSITDDVEINMDTQEVYLTLDNEFPQSDIRYTLHENKLIEDAIPYNKSIQIKNTTQIFTSLFENNKPTGRTYTKTVKFHKAVGKDINYKKLYHDKYQGEGKYGLVNTIRGSKNFSDGHWQGWLGEDLEIIIDLGEINSVKEVWVGTLENQGSGIYFPTSVKAYISKDGKSFEGIGSVSRPYSVNSSKQLKDFKISLKAQDGRYIKIDVESLKKLPNGGDVWLFVDEILIQ